MTTTLVQNTLINGSGQPLDGVYIEARLLSPSELGRAFVDTQQVISRTVTHTNSSGVWNLHLIPNSEITPSGTAYKIITKIKGWPDHEDIVIVPTGGGPVEMSDILTLDPSAIAMQAKASNITFAPADGIPSTDVQDAIVYIKDHGSGGGSEINGTSSETANGGSVTTADASGPDAGGVEVNGGGAAGGQGGSVVITGGGGGTGNGGSVTIQGGEGDNGVGIVLVESADGTQGISVDNDGVAFGANAVGVWRWNSNGPIYPSRWTQLTFRGNFDNEVQYVQGDAFIQGSDLLIDVGDDALSTQNYDATEQPLILRGEIHPDTFGFSAGTASAGGFEYMDISDFTKIWVNTNGSPSVWELETVISHGTASPVGSVTAAVGDYYIQGTEGVSVTTVWVGNGTTNTSWTPNDPAILLTGSGAPVNGTAATGVPAPLGSLFLAQGVAFTDGYAFIKSGLANTAWTQLPLDSADLSFDPGDSGITSTNVHDAIVEAFILNAGGGALVVQTANVHEYASVGNASALPSPSGTVPRFKILHDYDDGVGLANGAFEISGHGNTGRLAVSLEDDPGIFGDGSTGGTVLSLAGASQTFSLQIVQDDDTLHTSLFQAGLGTDGHAQIMVRSDGAQLQAKATSTQSIPVLSVKDTSNTEVFTVTETKVGLFNAAGLDSGSLPSLTVAVTADDVVANYNALRTALIALGVATDGTPP